MAGAADHEQPDDVLGLGREMRLPVGRLPGGWLAPVGPREPVAMQHRTEATPVKPMPMSARNARLVVMCIIGS